MSTGYAYVAVKPCGCFDAAASERCAAASLARWLGEWTLDGFTVARVTNAEVRANPWGCAVCKPKAQEALPL